MSDLDTLVSRLVTAGVNRAYKIGGVPPSPAMPYCVLGLDTGEPAGTRVGGDSPTLRRRMTVQMFGLSIDAVLDMARLADAAFRDQSLTDLAGAPFCAREISTPVTRDPDAEILLGALHTYRF